MSVLVSARQMQFVSHFRNRCRCLFLHIIWRGCSFHGGEMKFNIVAGVSAGSLNGYMVASDQMEKLEELWNAIGKNGVEEIYTSDFIVERLIVRAVTFRRLRHAFFFG